MRAPTHTHMDYSNRCGTAASSLRLSPSHDMTICSGLVEGGRGGANDDADMGVVHGWHGATCGFQRVRFNCRHTVANRVYYFVFLSRRLARV